MSAGPYVAQFTQALNREDGSKLAQLLAVSGPGLEYAMQVAQRGGSIAVGDFNSRLGQPWGPIAAGCLQASLAACKGEKLQACTEYREKVVKPLTSLIAEQAWIVPAVVTSATTLQQLSAKVDDELLRKGGVATHSQLSQCATLLQSIFGKTAAAKGVDADQRKAAAVAIGCIMFKVYFRLNTLTNCKNVVKTIDDTLRILDMAQASHRVTFRYYTGRLAAYDEDYVKADEHLSFALRLCHSSAVGNKRRILRYLVPVKMLLGTLPSEQLLQQYRLMEYAAIATAVRLGDVAMLTRELETHQLTLVQAGTYLLLEKLLMATYRRLFKKCALVHAGLNPGKASQVPLALFHAALESQGLPKEDAELQCLVANLIYRKYIKGYIAYKARVVVLAKADPFPPLATVQLGDPFG